MTTSISKLSIPVTSINVKEPTAVQGEFVYNFYLPQEDKEYSLTPTSPFINYGHTHSSANSYDLRMISMNTVENIEAKERGSIGARVPRYIQLSISRSTEGYDPLPLDGVNFRTDSWDTVSTTWTGGRNGNLYSTIRAGNYNVEGQIENNYNASITIQDSSAKSRNQNLIYRISTAKIEQGSIVGETSDLEIAAQIDAMTSEDVDATSIINMLADDSPLGQTYVNDVSAETRSPLDEKASIRYEGKFNVDAYKNVITKNMQSNPFLANFANDLLSKGLRNTLSNIPGVASNPLLDTQIFPDPPTTPILLTDGEEVSPTIKFINAAKAVTLWPRSPGTKRAVQKPKIYHIGYLIEKTALTPTGGYEEFEPKILLNPNETDFIDVEVKYGHIYTYRARQLYLVGQLVRVEDWGPGPSYYSNYTDAQHRFVTYIVASRSPNPLTIAAKEKTPPPSPGILFCNFMYSQGEGVRLQWQLPPDKTRDTKKFQVFRRETIEEPFSCIAEYDFTDEGYTQFKASETISPELIHKETSPRYYHIDNDFNREASFIYCIVAVDAHGLSSQLGVQMRAKFDAFTNKLVVEKVSAPGAPKAYPNMFIERHETKATKLTEDVATDSNHHTMRIHFHPDAYHYRIDQEVVSAGAGHSTATSTESLVLTQDEGTYKFQIINLDRQKTKILEAVISPTNTLSEILNSNN